MIQNIDSDPSSEIADPIDVEAAQIDARAPDAGEQIDALVEHAEALGRDTDVPGSTVGA